MAAKLRLALSLIAVCLCLFIAGAPLASAQTVAESYSAASTVEVGQIVQLVPNTSNKVEVLTASNSSKMFGVVINPSDTALSLSQDENGQQIYVADSGTYPVLVDNQNGSIHPGDYVAVSSVAGIGETM